MRLFFATILSLLVFTSYAQENKESNKKLRVGVSFSPDYAYRVLKSSNDDHEGFVQFRNQTESPKFGFTTGLRGLYQLAPKWNIEFGIVYSDKGEKEVWTTTTEIDPRYGFVYGGMNRVEFKYHYKYLDIPLKINYSFISKRAQFFASAGVSGNLFLAHTTESYYETSEGEVSEQRETNNAAMEPVNFALMFGLGVDYAIKSKMSLRIEPEFRHSITAINDHPIKRYPYSLGMNIGLFMLLK